MINVFSTVATWGPSTYYALGIANNLITPSIIKYQNGPSNLAKDYFPEIFEKVEKLRKDILIYRTDIPYAAALGTNFGPNAVLLINEDLALTDIEAFHFICKHELSHINSSDGFVASTLATTASAISTLVIPCLTSCLPWWAAPFAYCVPYLTGANIYNVAMAVFEDRADKFASCYATNEELQSVEQFVQANIEVNKILQPTYPQFFTSDGNQRRLTNITHSPLTERIEEIRSEYRRRRITPTNIEDPAKMERLKEFHRNTYQKFCKLKID